MLKPEYFRITRFNITAADGLAPYVPRTSTAMILTLEMLVFLVREFQQPATFQCWEIIENGNIDDLPQDCIIPQSCTKSCTVSEYPCPSQCPRPWQNCVYTTSDARIRGQPRQWPFLVASHHKKRRLWACTLHNLGRTRTSISEEIATCSDELGHGRPRQKSRTRTRTSVNAKQQFTCFDYVRARTRMLRPRSRM